MAFELQLVRFSSTNSCSIILMNIYLPPRCPISEFYDELADVITSICTASNDRLVLCGDINCLGVDGTCLHDGLVLLLVSLEVNQFAISPTYNNFLDIWETDAAASISKVGRSAYQINGWCTLIWFFSLASSHRRFATLRRLSLVCSRQLFDWLIEWLLHGTSAQGAL